MGKRKCKDCNSDKFYIGTNYYIFCYDCDEKIEYLEAGTHLVKTVKE